MKTASWVPSIQSGADPLYQRLFLALERDIAAGVLVPGARLPTHRDLAHRLDVSVGTATRAYAEAERRGLIVSHVGRGSFVSGALSTRAATAVADRVDLSRNLPPLRYAARHLTDGLIKIARDAGTGGFLDYPSVEGGEAHRRAAAQWIARTSSLGEVDWRRLILCNGAQHAMDLAFSALCRAGDSVLCEAATFPGMKAIARVNGLRLHGVHMDAEGLDPDALDQAAASTRARVLYATPTLQNPTARIMGAARRRAVAEVARKRDLLIVEDDVYSAYAVDREDVPPLASLAPERTVYVSSASKSIAPGLRAGWLLPPSAGDWRDRILARLRASMLALPAFGHGLLARWIDDGTADGIIEGVRAEMCLRLDAARGILGSRMETPPVRSSLHVWVPLAPLEAERCAARAMAARIALTPPSSVAVNPDATSGIRICLGGASDIDALGAALRVVAKALSGESSALEQAAL